MPRTEFSPHLELIRTSEVDPHNGPGSRKRSAKKSETSANLDHAVEVAKAKISLARGEALDQRPEGGSRSYKEEAWKSLDRTRVLTTVAAIAALFGTSVLFSDEDLVASNHPQ